MKRLILPSLLVAALALSALLNVYYLEAYTSDLISGLEQAQAAARQGDPELAFQITQQMERSFLNRSFYLHITLFHSDIDEVETSFREVLAHLAHGDTSPTYFAANSKLLSKLRMLSEGEQLNWENIF